MNNELDIMLCKEIFNDKQFNKKTSKTYCEHNRRKARCKDCGGKYICEHNRIKSTCKDCGGKYICEHNRIKSRCKDCGGISICEHNKIKYNCKDCGCKYICEHNKNKYNCKECGYISICEHNRIKSTCIDCGGKYICEHNTIKSRCKDCGGISICEHNRIKSACKECKGNSICEHNRIKYNCKDCGGISICEHNRIKSACKDCGGVSICKHGKNKSRCKDCGGFSICKHRKRKSICIVCGGKSICEHKKIKVFCKICDGKNLCKSEWCETHGNKKYEGYCLPCFVNNPENKYKPALRNYKTKEIEVVNRITESFPDFSWVSDKKIKDGCSRKRPDLLLDMGTHIIIVEIDENKHTNYDCSCENKRLMEISQDLNHRSVVFIRFNPDHYINEDGIKIKSCWKLNKLGVMSIIKTKQLEWDERIKILKEQIQYWIDNPTEKTIEIIELFY